MALTVPTQKARLWQRVVAYLSKQLDTMTTGCPPSLHALATTVTLIKESGKLIMGQAI